MRIYNRTPHAEYTQKIHDIAGIIYDSLFRTTPFSDKLKRLTVSIKTAEKVKAFCMCALNAKGEDVFKINMELPDCDIYLFEFVAAHEFAHLLFNRQTILSDFLPTDDTYSQTTIQRFNAHISYGKVFEDMTANYMALRVLMLIHNISYEEAKSFVPRRHLCLRWLEAAEKLIEAFEGTFDFGKETELYSHKNSLLVQACETVNIAALIYEYDSCMGYGAWKELMSNFDLLKTEPDEEKIFNFIYSEIDRFNCEKSKCRFFRARERYHKS